MTINLYKYESHDNIINNEDQVQIYEAIMVDTENNLTHTLLNASRYIKDNRILPKGFDKNAISNEIAVIGKAMDDNNFKRK